MTDLSRFTVALRGGKNYLTVAGRLVMFREKYPAHGIQTELLDHDPQAGRALFRATLTDEAGRTLAQAHGSETRADFGEYLEKAESKAVGRALVFLGFGTDAAGYDMDEGERFADAPQQPQQQPRPLQPPQQRPAPAGFPR